MADYSSVLSRAIAGKKTHEERRVVYDRARNALINQLRALQPPLPEADITRQRLALEESIRKVEAEAMPAEAPVVDAPQASPEPSAPVPPPAPQPPSPSPSPSPQAAPAPSLPSPPPPAAALPPLPSPRAEPPSPRPMPLPPEPPPPPPRPPVQREPTAVPRPPEPAPGPVASPLADTVMYAQELGQASASAVRSARGQLEDESAAPARRADTRVPADLGPGEPALTRLRSLPAAAPERLKPNRRPLIFGVIAALLVAVIAGVGYFFFVYVPNDGSTRTQVAGQRPQPPKFTDQIPLDTTGQPQRPPAGATEQPAQPQAGATLAQTALLYEENADNPRGADSFRGQVTWRVDTEAGPQGPERIIRGLVEIPERGLKVLLTIRRNSDQALPASHTVELLFDTQPTFVHGAVENVAGVRMKPSEQANGVPLVGASARITAGYFLIGLTAVGPDRDRNIVLLRDRPWMDVPIVYRNGRRAVLAIEKGAPGEQAFEQAFQAWR